MGNCFHCGGGWRTTVGRWPAQTEMAYLVRRLGWLPLLGDVVQLDGPIGALVCRRLVLVSGGLLGVPQCVVYIFFALGIEGG